MDIVKDSIHVDELIEISKKKKEKIESLNVRSVDELNAEKLEVFLKNSGKNLSHLSIRSHCDASELSWNELTPSLRHVEIWYMSLPSSILKHPSIIDLNLRELWVRNHENIDHIDVMDDLHKFSVDDCNICASSLRFGPKSKIGYIWLGLDEDYSEQFIDVELDNVQELYSFNVHVEYPMHFVFKGRFPRIVKKNWNIWKQTYSSHTYNTEEFEEKPKYIKNLGKK